MGRRLLGEILVSEGLINSQQLRAALVQQQRVKWRLGELLIRLGYLTKEQMWNALAKSTQMPLFDLASLSRALITRDLIARIPFDFAWRERIVPIGIREIKNRRMFIVATSNPANQRAIFELQSTSALSVFVMLAPENDIEKFIQIHYERHQAIDSGASVSEFNVTDSRGRPALDPLSSIFTDREFLSARQALLQKKKEK